MLGRDRRPPVTYPGEHGRGSQDECRLNVLRAYPARACYDKDIEYGESRAGLRSLLHQSHQWLLYCAGCRTKGSQLDVSRALAISSSLTMRRWWHAAVPQGGGATVINTLNGDPTASEALSSEIEGALRSLASKLQALTYDRGPGGADAIGGDNVLLDVVLGDVRLLALRP